MNYASHTDLPPTFKRIPNNLYQYELISDGATTYAMGDLNQDMVFEFQHKVTGSSTISSPPGPIQRTFGDKCTPSIQSAWVPYSNDQSFIASAGLTWSTYKNVAMAVGFTGTTAYTDLSMFD
jgi:hypothetical protein